MCDLIINIWFAWHPVKTINKEWIWLKFVKRTIDERPVKYHGLLPEITYEKLEPIKKISADIETDNKSTYYYE
jgi:hypothetical protein